jgi:hypothetical protein
MPGDIYFGQALASRQAIKFYRVFLKNVDVLMDIYHRQPASASACGRTRLIGVLSLRFQGGSADLSSDWASGWFIEARWR